MVPKLNANLKSGHDIHSSVQFSRVGITRPVVKNQATQRVDFIASALPIFVALQPRTMALFLSQRVGRIDAHRAERRRAAS
jgi:hypothetical protein